jgi:hypothetical protein
VRNFPPYYLFTSAEGAERIGGKVTESTLDRLASTREVEFTMIGKKIHWTDAQLADAVAYCAVPAGEKKATPQPASEPAKPQRQRKKRHQQAGLVVSLDAAPGRRYSTA